ncbi:MAG: hypothetical protein B7Z78_07635 [Rhodospirillales bacterium 20-60-12]|nr:MAG: hypothetical protein B7Z78_07635 [Rhodospirillales bacterium 20-60-12]HQT67244.1 winged helix-turn-helix domain-containing protein [Acetobacteraceae bacterium]
MARRLLIAGRNLSRSRQLTQNFRAEGFNVERALDTEQAAALCAMAGYDVVIMTPSALDEAILMLSRLVQNATKIICLLALDGPAEQRLLDLGAVLCLPAAASFGELLGILRWLIGKAEGFPQHYRIGRLGIDPQARRASYAGQRLTIGPTAFLLILALAQTAPAPRSADDLHECVWPGRAIDRHRIVALVNQLRSQLSASGAGRVLVTVGRRGYALMTPRDEPAAEPVPDHAQLLLSAGAPPAPLARARQIALDRVTGQAVAPVCRMGRLHLDLVFRRMIQGDNVVGLSVQEANLLGLLTSTPDRSVTKSAIASLCMSPRANAAEALVSRLRRKLATCDPTIRLIRSSPGCYRLATTSVQAAMD